MHRLFISYSHDSREHEDRVLALADRLRTDGIDALVDQYDLAPSDGWAMWADREIRKADFIALAEVRHGCDCSNCFRPDNQCKPRTCKGSF